MNYSNESNPDKIVTGAENHHFLKRISWGSVIAGFLLAVVINLTLNLLGLGLGLGSIDPMEQNAVPNSIGIGSIIWYVISTIISLVAGGWVAAHLAGVPNRWDSVLHGLLSWCLFTIFSFYLLTTAVGKIIGVTGSVVGQAFSLVGQGASALAPEVADLAQQELEQSDISVQRIAQEAKEILSQTGKDDLQPAAIEQQVEESGQQVENTAKNPAQLDEVIQRIFAQGDSIISDVDKEAIVNVLVARTEQSQAEAQQTVDRWANQYQQAQQKLAQVKQQAETKARATAEGIASAISTAAIAGFFGLLVGALSSGAGGMLGRPKEALHEEEYA